MQKEISEAVKCLRKSNDIVIFSGAGISVESGIPCFRGVDGIWSKYDPSCLDIDNYYANSIEAWSIVKEIFYDSMGKAEPNDAHKIIAEWERRGKVKAVITQNIDNLHQQAGSSEVYEFHGTTNEFVCSECGLVFPKYRVNFDTKIPLCPDDGQLLKPNFVFFGEGIPEDAYQKSLKASRSCDIMIIVGTKGEVMPASMMPGEAKRNGAIIIEINTELSNYSNNETDILIQGKATEVFKLLNQAIF